MTLSLPSGARGAEPVVAALDPASDRAYCRAMLPRVSRTFAINIRLLPGSFGEAVRVAYLLCRASDALEDSWPGEPENIARRFDRFLEGVAGDRAAANELADSASRIRGGHADLDLVSHLPIVLRALDALGPRDRAAIVDSLGVMARGMRRYAVRASERANGSARVVPYLDSGEDLLDYCYVVAGCVGEMLTRLFDCRSPAAGEIAERRLQLAPVVGEALQLTNIFLDWPSDLARGRCHVPAAWLQEFGLEPAQLGDIRRPGVLEIANRLESCARASLARVPAYLELVPNRCVRYRLFCLWPALWARASLDHARRDPAFPCVWRRPKLPRSRLWGIAIGSMGWAHDARAVSRRLAIR